MTIHQLPIPVEPDMAALQQDVERSLHNLELLMEMMTFIPEDRVNQHKLRHAETYFRSLKHALVVSIR